VRDVYNRGRGNRLPGSPSLRTVRAVLPYTAFRPMVLSLRGLYGVITGCGQAKQPVFGETLTSISRAVGIRSVQPSRPPAADFSSLLGQAYARHCRRCLFHLLGLSESISLHPFAPGALPSFTHLAFQPIPSPTIPHSPAAALRRVTNRRLFGFPYAPTQGGAPILSATGSFQASPRSSRLGAV